MRQRSRRLWAPGVTMAVALGASVLSAVAIPSGPPHALGPTTAPGHVAFTDDTDRLARFSLDGTQFYDAGRPPLVGTLAAAPHEGEASVTGDRGRVYTAFVSTAAGTSDVYLATPFSGEPIRVTCNGTSSQPAVALAPDRVPVPGNSGAGNVADQIDIAWASDTAGANNGGHWNVWTTTVTVWSPRLGTVAGTGCQSGTNLSAAVAAPQPLTGQRGDNLWPAWRQYVDPSAPGNPTQLSVLYESTRDNPLGDIYEQGLSGAATRRTDGTTGHLANTQPAVYEAPYGYGVTSYLLFTTTKYRPDGSLSSIELPGPGVAGVAATAAIPDAWGKGAPQSSDAAVAETCLGQTCGPWVAYRSTSPDALGDVMVTLASYDIAVPLQLGGHPIYPVTADPGVAESQPALQTVNGQLSGVLVTQRATAARVSAVRLADGGARGVLAAANPDEGAVAYSPDGLRIAYSELVLDGNNQPLSRHIVVANADGSGAVVQDFGQAADQQRSLYDFDTQPSWSPDGTQLAFIREQYLRGVELSGLVAPPQLYVATVGTTSAEALIGDTTRYDSHPSWSPDGTSIVLSRSLAPADLSPYIFATVTGGTAVLTARLSNDGFGPSENSAEVITLPAGLALTRAPANCSPATSTGAAAVTVTCTVGTLAPSGPAAAVSLSVAPTATCGTPSFQVTETGSTASADSGAGATSSTTVAFDLGACIQLVPGGGVRLAATPVAPNPPQQFGTALRGIPGAPGPAGQPQLWVVDAGTGAGGPLVTADTGTAVAGAQPAWSPDGRQIAYTALDQLDLATLTAAGTAGTLSAVTGYDGDYVAGTGGTPMPSRAALSAAGDPVWTPDGSEIVFAGQPAGRPDDSGIYAVKPDGTGLRTLAQQAQPETEPGVEPYRDATVTLTATPPAVLIGQPTTLTATVRDSGNTLLGSGTLTITLPAGLSVTAAGLPAGCSLAAATISCAVGALAPGASAAFPVAATGVLAGAQPVTAAYPVARDRNPADNTATTTVVVGRAVPTADVAVTIALSQPVAYVGGPLTATITVTNHGPAPAAVTLQTGFSSTLQASGTPACLAGGSPCSVGTLAPGGSAAFTVHLVPGAVGNPAHGYGATLTAKVSSPLPDPVPANNTATVGLPVKQPAIRLLPAVQSPGFVTLAYGQDFPPGAGVLLTWDPGITTYPGPFTVAADGTLRAPMLIVGRDVLGQRAIVATSTGHQFGPVKNTMLVVPRTEAPPGFLERG